MDDVARLRAALRAVEAGAKTQPWDRQRPWRVATHVGWHGEVPLVDLHDLKVKHAKAAVRTALDTFDPHEGSPGAGAVVFVTGRGRHSLRHDAPVKQAVHGALAKACIDRTGWSLRQPGPGRVVWIYDRARAPSAVTGGGGGWLWLWFVGIAAAAVIGVVGKGC